MLGEAPSMWAEQVFAMVRKDLLLEARTRSNINSMLFFAAMVVLLFSFALGPSQSRLRDAAGGLIWLALIFAGLLAVGRSYQLETENDAFEGLLLVAENRGTIYLGKVIGTTAVMLLIEALVVPLMAVLYNLDLWSSVPALAGIGLLGAIGFAATGSLYGALTMSLRAREVLLPLLLLPVISPVLLGAVKATTAIIVPNQGDAGPWVDLLLAFDVVFLTSGYLTYEYAVEA
jgi:heme exporter protein B